MPHKRVARARIPSEKSYESAKMEGEGRDNQLLVEEVEPDTLTVSPDRVVLIDSQLDLNILLRVNIFTVLLFCFRI